MEFLFIPVSHLLSNQMLSLLQSLILQELSPLISALEACPQQADFIDTTASHLASGPQFSSQESPPHLSAEMISTVPQTLKPMPEAK